MKMRIAGVLLLAAAIGVAGGCGGGGGTASLEESAVESVEYLEKPAAVEKEGVESDVEIENPFIDTQTLENAEKVAGFDLTLPDAPEGYEISSYRGIPGELLEVILTGSGKEIRLRKGKGDEDISGDYNTYSGEETVTVGGIEVTEKKNDDGIHVAVWTNGDYSYSVTSDKGLSEELVGSMISKIS